MQVIEFFGCDRQEHWLDQIKKSDWRAGQFLYEKLSQNKLAEIAGKDPKVFLLTDGDELVCSVPLRKRMIFSLRN